MKPSEQVVYDRLLYGALVSNQEIAWIQEQNDDFRSLPNFITTLRNNVFPTVIKSQYGKGYYIEFPREPRRTPTVFKKKTPGV